MDFCVAQYTITDKRAATTDWLVLTSSDIFLVVQYEKTAAGWDLFTANLKTIFQPFTPGTWIFVVFFVVPVLGVLMLVHEYGHAGSAFPTHENVLVKDHGQEHVENRKIPLHKHVTRSIYVSLLGTLQQGYGHTVVTQGARWNLLGTSFFILTIIAVYTGVFIHTGFVTKDSCLQYDS